MIHGPAFATRTLGAVVALLLVSLLPNVAFSGATPTPRSGDAQWPLIWLDADGDCQNTAIEVLVRDAAGLVSWIGPDACSIQKGRWRSVGNGQLVGFEQAWVVPVVTPAQAVRRGALLWNRERQIAFLNELDNLMVLDPASAQRRGMKDLAEWQPASAYLCDYSTRWQDVSRRYGLQLSASDRQTLNNWRSGCPDSGS